LLQALVPSAADPLNSVKDTTVTRAFWELAQPLAPNADGSLALSWSIRLVAGADLEAADSRTVLPSDQLTAMAAIPVPGSLAPPGTTPTAGSIQLYDLHSQPVNPSVPNGTSFQLPGWSVIRTGTGDLDLLAGGSVVEGSTYAIYTAGAAPRLAAGSAYNLPRGTVATPAQVSFSGQSGTQVRAGSLVTDGTTVFQTLTTGTIRGFPATFTALVQPVPQGGVYNDPAGTTLTLVNPIAGVRSAKAAGLLSSSGTVLGLDGQAATNGASLESIAGNYHAGYPRGGGNVLISAGGDIAGYLPTPTVGANGSNGVQPMDGIGSFLWRPGGGAGASTAWWINFGTLALPLDQSTGGIIQSSPVPTLTGFTGIGTLGGGNVSLLAGGNVGATAQITPPSGTRYTVNQAIDVAIASTGRVAPGAMDASGLAQTGGGTLSIRASGALNGGGTAIGDNQANGTLSDTRGSINVVARSIGQIALSYGQANYSAGTGVGDPRAASPLVASQAAAQGGPIVVLGDATLSLSARGDLVLGGVGDPTRLTVQNLTPSGGTAGGAASVLT
jgi:hypothetical protein